MKKTLLLTTASLLLAIGIMGCVEGIDPNTGEKTYAVDPNVAAKIDQGADVVIKLAPIAQGAGALWPPLAVIASILAGIAGAWAKSRNQLAAAQSRVLVYKHSTEAAIRLVEEIKERNPQLWEELKAKARKTIGPEASAVIDALRATM